MRCFLCKKSDFRLVYRLENRNMFECQNDGLFFASEIKSSTKKFYDQNYYDNSPYSTLFNLNERYFLSKLKKIQELTGENKPKILDVGCGWGNFLEALQKEKMDYLGIDNNDEAIDICRSKNLNVRKTTLQDLLKENRGKFSAITMFQVIEHVKNPIELLKDAKKLLKKNGVILMTTPNNDSPVRKLFGAKWSVYNEPSHFVFYDKTTLSKTLSLAGFTNIKIRIDQVRFLSLGYILKRMEQIKKSKVYSLKSLISGFPIATDPLGDLQITAYNH